MAGIENFTPAEQAPGLPPTPAHDLYFHGGKTIPSLSYVNFYVGADAWAAGDMTNVEAGLAGAMTEPTLNNVMAQYFTAPPDDPDHRHQAWKQRVPCLALSPYVKAGYVSHQENSHVSLVRFCETTFGLTPLNQRHAASNGMSDCFDFSQSPLAAPCAAR